MANASPATIAYSPALQIDVKRRADAPVQEGQPQRCVVFYTLARIKQKINGFLRNLLYDADTDAPNFDFKTTEFIVMTLEPVVSTFHIAAYEMWNKSQIRVRFFQVAALVNNPTKHVLVPKHERLAKEEAEKILAEFYAKPLQLPIIRFHEDPIARVLGLLPMDIIRITRPSLTAGECVGYRVCWP
jgi:DNA-directed RNA polymerase subunit H (RpoH/RPB5)